MERVPKAADAWAIMPQKLRNFSKNCYRPEHKKTLPCKRCGRAFEEMQRRFKRQHNETQVIRCPFSSFPGTLARNSGVMRLLCCESFPREDNCNFVTATFLALRAHCS